MLWTKTGVARAKAKTAVKNINIGRYSKNMSQSTECEQVPEARSTEELLKGMKESFRDIKEGRTYSDDDAIRKRVEELRKR